MSANGDDIPGPRDIDERCADWVDGRMSERDRDRFEAELRVNPQLRRDLEQYERTVGVLRAALRAPLPGTPRAPIADRVLAAIQQEAAAPAVRAALPFRLQRLWWALASAAALLAVAFYLNGLEPAPARTDLAVLELASRQLVDDAKATGFFVDQAAGATVAESKKEQADLADSSEPSKQAFRVSADAEAEAERVGREPWTRDGELARKMGGNNDRRAKSQREEVTAEGEVGSVAPAPTPAYRASPAELPFGVTEPSADATRLANGKPAENAPGAAVSPPAAGPAAGSGPAGPRGPTTGGPVALRGDGFQAKAPGAPAREAQQPGGGDGTASGGLEQAVTGGEGSTAPEAERVKARWADQGAVPDDKSVGGKFGGRSRGAPKAAMTHVAMVLVEGVQPRSEERNISRGVAPAEGATKAKASDAVKPDDSVNKDAAKTGAAEKAAAGEDAARRAVAGGGVAGSAAAKRAAGDGGEPAKADGGKPTDKADGPELLDHDTLRARAAAFFAMAEDAEAGAAATTLATSGGRVELQPLLDVALELDESRLARSAAPAPAAVVVDRSWLVTGPRAEVQVVVAALADWSRQHGLVLRSGETKASPTLLAAAAPEEPALPAPTTKPGLAVESMQIVVRIRLRARQ